MMQNNRIGSAFLSCIVISFFNFTFLAVFLLSRSHHPLCESFLSFSSWLSYSLLFIGMQLVFMSWEVLLLFITTVKNDATLKTIPAFPFSFSLFFRHPSNFFSLLSLYVFWILLRSSTGGKCTAFLQYLFLVLLSKRRNREWWVQPRKKIQVKLLKPPFRVSSSSAFRPARLLKHAAVYFWN